jgi:hypothetical protein
MKALSLPRNPPPRGRRGGAGGSGAGEGCNDSRELRGDQRRLEGGGGVAIASDVPDWTPGSGALGLSKLMNWG